MRTAMAIFMNAIICIIYILGISLINISFPITHPNIAYGLTIIALAGILFVTQILLLLLLLSLGKNKFSFLIPLIVPCVYGLRILDAYPRRSFAFLSFLFVLYVCYYIILTRLKGFTVIEKDLTSQVNQRMLHSMECIIKKK